MKNRYIAILTTVALGLYLPAQQLYAYSISAWPEWNQPGSAASSTTKGDSSAPDSSAANENNLDLFHHPETAPKSVDNYKNDNLDPNDSTPETYRQPQFDPFNNKYRPQYDYIEVLGPVTDKLDSMPYADFTVFQDRTGLPEKYSGTTATIFKFSGSMSSDKETAAARLEVRFDWDSDGRSDTFFSRSKVQYHQFKTAGVYTVTMQVLDGGGNVSSVSKKMTIVENTPPVAYFSYKPVTATNGTVFSFDTGKSADSQYLRNVLKYRFDWDSDGKWDTQYNTKKLWKHVFGSAGAHRVTMEVMDPEGLTDTAYAEITTFNNTSPVPSFIITSKQNGGKTYYLFDASATTDSETAANNLYYRWDFNYTGEDDIVFDTNWTTSPKHSGTFSLPGTKNIRLQVKDADGAVSEAFGSLEVAG